MGGLAAGAGGRRGASQKNRHGGGEFRFLTSMDGHRGKRRDREPDGRPRSRFPRRTDPRTGEAEEIIIEFEEIWPREHMRE
jgi:hypothetical protein